MVRELTLRGQKRPANQSPTRGGPDTANLPKFNSTLRPPTDAPMLSASSSNNHSLFSFGRHGGPAQDDIDEPTTTYDFLPSVSFDDLQSSLESASTDFKLTQFPSPTGQGSILESQGLVNKMSQPSSTGPGGSTIRQVNPPITTRPARTTSLLGRANSNARQTSLASSTTSMGSGVPDAPTAPAAMRQRRQTHYPPVSNSHNVKPPRKSVGPGLFDPDQFTSRSLSTRRRPSLASATDRTVPGSARSSIDGGSRLGANDSTRNLTASRASKAKSIGPPPKFGQTTGFSPDSSTLSVDQSIASAVLPRSPRVNGTGNNNKGTPQSAGRRMSVMPGSHGSSHVTGLGARTISPTDTRRMKRMSVMPSRESDREPLPPQPTTGPRATSRSPSMLPRKTSTPSSSRTTPDPNRKSYSSGLSTGSAASFNTVRTSTGSIQPRLPTGTTSRIPPPKALNLPSAPPADDDEDVPPVPAIPKAYESPKVSPAEAPLHDKRKSNLAFDASSIHSTNSAGSSIKNYPTTETQTKIQRKMSTRKDSKNLTLDLDKKGNVSQPKRHLQPLRLPPISLGPLSTPTAAKIAKLKDSIDSNRNLSPPPARQSTKTPTTPLTASKSSFFSRHRHNNDRTEPINLRSSSSVHHTRNDSPLVAENTSSSESFSTVPAQKVTQKSSVSPFLSSSVPKDGTMETALGKRVITGNSTATSSAKTSLDFGSTSAKPSGPRAPAPKTVKTKTSGTKSPPPLASPDQPPTPSSMSSLRRKLSLSWKRSNSKSSINFQPGTEKLPDSSNGVRQDSMPPPRLPVSSTTSGQFGASTRTSSPGSTTAKQPSANYLEARRRKSSASSLNAILAQDKVRTDSWGTDRSVSKDPGAGNTMSHSSSVMQKILRPKPSTSMIRHHDVWTAELDKDDLAAEDEMKKLGQRRKETELAARTLDALRKRATPKERVSAQDAIRIAMLNIYERGEIVDYSDIYFCGTQNAAKVVGNLKSDVPNFGYDDERGDYSIVPGDHLAYRYEVIDILGKGSFGQVVRCIDHKTGVLVAVKIIRNKKRFHQQALVEVNILQKLREWDPKNKHSMVNFTHSFYFRGHLCISTELLDMNLYEFIKSHQFRGFSLKLIRRFTKQLLSSLNLLKQHKVIHCDLKPENILLRHPLHSELKVIDFGSSCFENEKVYTYIQSRFYRSPEVILGMAYGMPIDMWSLGCILAELYTGVPIFPGENEQEQLACIMEVFGPPEKHLIEKSTRKKLFFDSMGKPRLTVSSKGRRRRPSSKTLQQVLKCDDEPFLDFLARCLRWDPDRRIKPDDAIRHEFITGQKTSVPVRVNMRDGSPMKRHNTISTPRPLPEPPGTAFKSGTGFRAGSSPHKPAIGSRRTSAVSATSSTAASAVNKRTSTGTGMGGIPALGGSNLPRAAGRAVSAKQDLAAAGANAAMTRRV